MLQSIFASIPLLTSESDSYMGSPKAWVIRKILDAQPLLHVREYSDMKLVIVHDHTHRRQRTVLAISNRMTPAEAVQEANNICNEIGYALERPMSDLGGFVSGFASGDYVPRYWAAGSVRIKKAKTSRLPTVEMGEVPEEHNPELATDLRGRLTFPRAGNGVLLTVRPFRQQWHFRVWAYGKDRSKVKSTAALWASTISGSNNVVAVSRSVSSGVAGVSSLLAVVFWLLAVTGNVSYTAGAATAAVTAVIAIVGFIRWAGSPVRRSCLPSQGLPAAVKRAMKPRRKRSRKGRAVEFPLAEGTDPSMCVDVPIDFAVLPDIGGVMVGLDGAGNEVRIPDRDRYVNITVVGSPGSGKTTIMMQMAGGDMMRMRNGENSTMIWFETKQDGAAQLVEMAEKAGLDPLYFVPGSNQGPQLRWLDWTDPHAASGTLTESLVASFDSQSIMEQSRDVIASLIDMASLVWPAHLQAIGESKVNLMRTAWIFAGGKGWATAENLMEQVKKKTPNQERYNQCRERLGSYYGRNERDREQKMSSALNKLNRLKDFPAWSFDLDRNAYTWRNVLEMRRPVIVDISKYTDSGMVGYSEEMIRILLPTALFTFWSQAQSLCAGWYAQNKSVSLYCDEASNLAGNSGRILSEISTQGRSHGISLVLGAQGWTQLSELTQIAFRAAGHKFFFSLNDSESAAVLAEDFSVDSHYKRNSLTHLKPYQTVAIMRIDGERYGPVLLRTVDHKMWDPETAWRPAAA